MNRKAYETNAVRTGLTDQLTKVELNRLKEQFGRNKNLFRTSNILEVQNRGRTSK